MDATSYTDSDVDSGQDYYYWVRGLTTETVVNSHSWSMLGDGGTLSMYLSMTSPTSAKRGDATPLRGEVKINVTSGSHDSSTLETAFKEADIYFNDTMASWEHTGQLVSYEYPINKTYSASVVLSDYEPLNSVAEVYLSSHYRGYGLTPMTTSIVDVALRDYSDVAPSNLAATGNRNSIQINWNPSTGNTAFSGAIRGVSAVDAYYPFNGNANDESGNGYDGTVTGATLIPDRFGTADSAYSFPSTSDYIEVPSSPTPTTYVDFSAWVRLDANRREGWWLHTGQG